MIFNCKLCGGRFDGQEELAKHLRLEHVDEVELAMLEHPMGGKALPSHDRPSNLKRRLGRKDESVKRRS